MLIDLTTRVSLLKGKVSVINLFNKEIKEREKIIYIEGGGYKLSSTPEGHIIIVCLI